MMHCEGADVPEAAGTRAIGYLTSHPRPQQGDDRSGKPFRGDLIGLSPKPKRASSKGPSHITVLVKYATYLARLPVLCRT